MIDYEFAFPIISDACLMKRSVRTVKNVIKIISSNRGICNSKISSLDMRNSSRILQSS